MKLALIGGGGVRAPLFVQSALRRAEALGLDELCLMDIPGSGLQTFGALAKELARQQGGRTRITMTCDSQVALRGADFVITTVRPGGIDGRITDERIALDAGVLGQETTGAGGFAMALRSVPVILEYARQMADICPNAWLLNFTNPAGLVTQALHNAGFARAIGICDSANGAQRALAKWFDVPEQTIETDLFGLNHLSFTRRAILNGRNVLPEALQDDAFLDTSAQRVFAHDVVRRQGMWLNEYLYYFYYAEKARQSQRTGKTRGEEIKALNEALLPELEKAELVADPAQALKVYFAYEHRRSAGYMAQANQSGSAALPSVHPAVDDGEGYAGVALGIIAALAGGTPIRSGLNTRNNGAISGLGDDDVVEVTCRVDSDGVHPQPVGDMPSMQGALIRTIKTYERMTVDAIRDCDRELAIDALVVHPLVQSYPRAQVLVDRFLHAHAEYVGDWRRT